MSEKNKKGMSASKMVAIGAGIAAVGAGAYYALGPNGKKNMKKAGAMIKKAEKKIEAKAKPFLKKEGAEVAKLAKKTIGTMKKIATATKSAKKK